MFNRSLKWLAGAALSSAALAAVPSLTEAHAHYTGTTPPSLMAFTAAAPRTHLRAHAHTLVHHSRKLSVSKKAHKLVKHHHHLKKHKKSFAKHKAA